MPETKRYTDEELRGWDEETAHTNVTQAVYQALAIVERLELLGKIYGNGHHFRQSIATEAGNRLKSSWKRASSPNFVQTDVA